MSDVLEFYKNDTDQLIKRVHSSIVPPVNSLISIKYLTYKVIKMTFAIDDPTGFKPEVRVNIDLEAQ